MPSRRPSQKPRIRKRIWKLGEIWDSKVHKERRIKEPNFSGHLGTFRMTPIKPVFGVSKLRRSKSPSLRSRSRLPIGELNSKNRTILLFDDKRSALMPHSHSSKPSKKRKRAKKK